jgi:predicted Zn-dependent protease
MTRAGYAPGAMVDVFGMLEDVSRAAGASAVPGWLSTHPAPENRQGRINAAITAQGLSAGQGTVNADGYLRLLDGLVFGENPRHGYFEAATFYHPEMQFRLDFPTGWKTLNQSSVVAGRAAGGEATIQLTLADGSDATAAADKFFATAGIERGRSWRQEFNGLRAVSADFRAVSGQEVILGRAAFITHAGKVFRLLGYAAAEQWPGAEATVSTALGTFRRLTDAKILAVQPRRLEIVSLASSMSLEEFNRRSPSTVPLATLALLNRVSPSTPLGAGRAIKRVVGGP